MVIGSVDLWVNSLLKGLQTKMLTVASNEAETTLCNTRWTLYLHLFYILGLPLIFASLIGYILPLIIAYTTSIFVRSDDPTVIDYAKLTYWSRVITCIVFITSFILAWIFAIDRPLMLQNCS